MKIKMTVVLDIPDNIARRNIARLQAGIRGPRALPARAEALAKAKQQFIDCLEDEVYDAGDAIEEDLTNPDDEEEVIDFEVTSCIVKEMK